MSSVERKLNDRQQAFIAWYVKTLNATNAARRAGYTGNAITLGVTGHNLLKNPKIRAEVDRRIKESIISADELLGLVSATATADVTPYMKGGQLDVQGLADAGLGHLVVGVKPGREGTEITLANPQTARKLLARYHRLLGDRLDVDVTTTASLEPDALASLAQQIAAASADAAQQDDAE